jgi:hypothetical protein
MWTERVRLPPLHEDHFPVALIAIAMAAVACVTPPQSDTFYHLRIGQHIWQTGANVSVETFSHTFEGRPLFNHWWMTQVVFYMVHAAGGPLLLTILSGGLAFAALFASWTLTRGRAEIRLALLLGLIVLTPPEWAVRPQVVSLALLTLTAWLAVHNRVAWLPLVMLVWANAHGVVLFGIVVAAAYWFEALVWSRRDLPRASIVVALCVAAPTATPLGWHFWPYVAQTVEDARLLDLHEYRSAFADVSSVPFWLMLGVLVVTVCWRLRHVNEWARADRLLVLSSGVLALAAIVSIRNAPFFALLAVPAISRLIPGARPRAGRPLARPAYAVIGVAALVAVVVVALQWRRDGAASLRWRPMSPSAVRAVRDCPGPIYNEFGEGGTLMWFVPEHKVFVDGRTDAYPLEFLQRVRQADLFGRYQGLFAEYAVRCAVTRTESALTRALLGDPSATLRFSDGRWAVFVMSSVPELALGSRDDTALRTAD